MRNQSCLMLAVTVTLTLSSCYYPAQVVIHNKSGADKNIRVIYPPGYTGIAKTDSLSAYDHTLTANAFSTRDYYRHGVNIPLENLDSLNKTFTFLVLPSATILKLIFFFLSPNM